MIQHVDVILLGWALNGGNHILPRVRPEGMLLWEYGTVFLKSQPHRATQLYT